MPLFPEIVIVFVLIAFQSIFGIGLLLFGTPAFLMIGYDFESTLVLLLPVSIMISMLQLVYGKSSIKHLVSEYNYFCLPFLLLFLVIALNLDNFVNLKLYISIFLILSSLATINKNKIIQLDNYLLKYRKLCLICIGSIHGFKNMGGGFLSLFSGLINGHDRLLTRKYISYGYLTMGIVQYITVLLFGSKEIDFTKLQYIFLSLLLFFPCQMIFSKMDNHLFVKIIYFVALMFGITALTVSLKR